MITKPRKEKEESPLKKALKKAFEKPITMEILRAIAKERVAEKEKYLAKKN